MSDINIKGQLFINKNQKNLRQQNSPEEFNKLQNHLRNFLEIKIDLVANPTPGFTYIPTNRFIYGGNSAGAGPKELKKVSSFFIQTEETSLGEYVAFLTDLCQQNKIKIAESHFPRTFGQNRQDQPLLKRVQKEIKPKLELLMESWPDTTKENWKQTPVRGITYLDAKAYLNWLNKKTNTNKNYRLPTEEEWELASRGVDGRKYGWGPSFEKGFTILTQGYGAVNVQANHLELKKGFYRDESAFGVKNMGGGVAEWVEGYFNSEDAISPPKDSSKILRVIRGNAWGLTPVGLGSAFRTNGPES